MSLSPGSGIGPYEIVSLLGVGGMGEVYRARDAKLQRDVAIKILPSAFAGDPERLARFEREAQVLASLNHPNIAAIYGFEPGPAEGGRHIEALILELVEGPTLADRLAEGPIPIDEALPIARQIAEALDAAHEHGVIHRDLKPSNIKLRPDGTVKVLDFGLAKMSEATASPTSVSLSPTITSPAQMTGIGMLLGTAAYMAPEQAKGKAADKRSDIWAFGCTAYEMLTGRRAFAGDDVSDTLAAVLRAEPDWHFPAAVPPAITTLIRACLQKDRRRRPGDASALLFAIEHAFAITSPAPVIEAQPASRRGWWTAAAVATALVLGALAAAALIRFLEAPAPQIIARFEVGAPSGLIFPTANGVPRFAISPDGQMLVFQAGAAPDGPFHLWLRRLDRLDAEPLRLTAANQRNQITGVFWFADGRALGYFDEVSGKLKRIDLQTGNAQNIADVSGTQPGGTANDDGTVLFASVLTNGIFRVSATGGTPVQVTTPDSARRETRHLWPRFLPDGRHFLYFVQYDTRATASAIYVGSLDGPERTQVIESSGMAEFALPNQLLFMRNDTLLAQSMDMTTFALVGEPVIIAQPVFATAQGRPGFSVSTTGVLVHSTGTEGSATIDQRRLIWVDRKGHEEPLAAPVRSYASARLSPDGTRIALGIADQDESLWVWDIARLTLTRLTFDRGREFAPVWTPDSRRIVYAGISGGGAANLFSIAADGVGMPERLTQSTTDQFPFSVSPDGAEVLFDTNTGDGALFDLHSLALKSGTSRRLFTAPRNQRFGSVSPNGQWILYQSAESERNEIYVRPYPNVESGRTQVSTNQGNRPLWSKDGRELFYGSGAITAPTLFSVSVNPGQTWSASLPKAVFSHPDLPIAGFDVSSDGRFLLISNAAPTPAPSKAPATLDAARLTVVVNWQEELKRRAN